MFSPGVSTRGRLRVESADDSDEVTPPELAVDTCTMEASTGTCCTVQLWISITTVGPGGPSLRFQWNVREACCNRSC